MYRDCEFNISLDNDYHNIFNRPKHNNKYIELLGLKEIDTDAENGSVE